MDALADNEERLKLRNYGAVLVLAAYPDDVLDVPSVRNAAHQHVGWRAVPRFHLHHRPHSKHKVVNSHIVLLRVPCLIWTQENELWCVLLDPIRAWDFLLLILRHYHSRFQLVVVLDGPPSRFCAEPFATPGHHWSSTFVGYAQFAQEHGLLLLVGPQSQIV